MKKLATLVLCMIMAAVVAMPAFAAQGGYVTPGDLEPQDTCLLYTSDSRTYLPQYAKCFPFIVQQSAFSVLLVMDPCFSDSHPM